MKLSEKMMAAAAFAALLMPAFNLRAEAAEKPSAAADPAAAMPPAPMPADSTPADSTPAAMPYSEGMNFGTPKAELFLGYSYLQAVPKLADGNRLVWLNGGSTSIAFNFNRYLGVVGDFGGFGDTQLRLNGAANPAIVQDSSGSVYTYLAGPRLSYRRHERITPFAQVLFGGIHASQVTLSSGCTAAGCMPLPAENTFAMTAGGGLDIRVRQHLAIRILQAEYLMTRFDNLATGTSATQNDMRLSSGIVLRFGGNPAPPPQLTLSCSASPSSVFPGDPVTVTAIAGNLDPRLNAIYSLTGPGVTADGAAATVTTAMLAPGSYTVNCGVKEGRPGREGLKPWESATATATFTVRPFEPPTISCSASPSIINPGDKSAITATGVSPQNRPLTYSYSAASGTVMGSGATASFDSTGAAPGAIGINCNVTDDKGQTATAGTSVTITAPTPPVPSPEQVQLETRLALHSVFFQTDQPRAEHPEGGLVASQEGTLTTLASDFKKYLEFKPDAHLTLSGHADVRGSVEYNQALSERRVARTKQFLVEQGVPEASIETRGLGKDQELTADQVKDLVDQNPDLSTAHRDKILRDLNVIVLAQNRRVDVVLSTTGQESVRLYPFNAADSLTLLDERNLATRKKAAAAAK
jgi:outer membrane protein OmpA-like peptidoglycan-associated protein/opacity protein-like surface antigen